MAIRNDETGKRWVEIETIVPGTPEQVWQAIATGPGVAAWYVKAQIERPTSRRVARIIRPALSHALFRHSTIANV